MENLKKETLQALESNNETFEDVIFIQSGGQQISKENFLEAIDFEYHNGYGCQEIVELQIFTADNIYYRHEYDGAEWWKSFPIPKKEKKIIELAIAKEFKFKYEW